MNTLRNLIFGAAALAGLALATPAQAHSHYSHHYYGHHYYHGGFYGGPVVSYGGPYYTGYDAGYYPSYPVYGYTPGISFAFGGHGGYYHHHYSHHSYHHHR